MRAVTKVITFGSILAIAAVVSNQNKRRMQMSVSLIVAMLVLLAPVAFAKRAARGEVKPVVHEGIGYLAPSGVEKMGVVEAREIPTGEILWEKKVYTVALDTNLEENVQHVFITKLEIDAGKLIVTTARKDCYSIDLKTRVVTKVVMKQSAAKDEPSSPPKDSPERKAILDALLPPLNKAEGAKVKFVDDGTILVLNGWATVANTSFVREDGKEFSSGGGMFEPDYLGVVQRVGTEWRIRYWGFAGDVTTQVEARRANPEAPAQLILEGDAILAIEKAAREAEEPERNKVGIFSAKPGTPERKEIIETIRPRIEKELGEPVTFRVDFIHVGKEWALFRGLARKADDSQFPYGTKLDYVTVLLKKSETGWQIVDRSMPIFLPGDMLMGIDDLSDLQKKFPKAPALLFPPGVPVF
jgi:hypothetical protein